MSPPADDSLSRLRDICLWCPEAAEEPMRDRPAFRVRSRIFAMYRTGDGGPALWLKAPPGSQMVLVGSDPARFYVPPYVGPKGWIGMRLDRDPDWDEVRSLVRRSYRMIAPRRLAELVP